MPGFLPDTSCIVAAVCAWHEHHDRAAEEIERRLSRGEKMIVAAPALVEAYAVLTRLPPPHRLSTADTLALLEANFMRATRIVALEGKSYRTLLRGAPDEGIIGGRIYDVVIAACVFKAKAAVLLTFNESHFLPFVERGMEVVVPARDRL
ncbi:MAG TPA: PIN domain-containing protein [Thermodesulfobacteriota bacterium]|nr:PIN domain-containing protein [Thermodesulfobacteriota bacterium]